jgi:two-component system NarL family sensor kinase
MHESFSEAKLILFASTAMVLLLIFVIVAAVLIQQKRKFVNRQRFTDLQNQYDKTLLQTELKNQEETFKAISQTLHDNIGSNISTAMLLLYKDGSMTPLEFDTNRMEALTVMDKVVDDLKNIARSLNPDYLWEIGLTEAIRQRLAQLSKTRRYQLDSQLEEAPAVLDRTIQLIVFYTFQEAVNNIITHAKAKIVEIILHYQAGGLFLMISDDGVGLTNLQAKTGKARGSGLINMKHHANMIGGKITIGGLAGEGTKIQLFVPDPYHKP